jgi:L-alanine-DL-glutamate epimerase-like enolase superfamily enzyme
LRSVYETKLAIRQQSWPIAGEFRIARGAKTSAEVIVVTLTVNGKSGHGECVPYARYGETLDKVSTQIESLDPALAKGMDRNALQSALPAGAARNALDCAFWDLECQISKKSVYELAEIEPLQPTLTAYTLSMSGPAKMAAAAASVPDRPLLKLKLAGDRFDRDRVLAIANARPDARLILDGNEGFDLASLQALLQEISDVNIAAIEQPLPAGKDQELADIRSQFALCADESLHTRADLPEIAAGYDMVNIKLDKTGGLTEALQLREEAQALGLKIMVGCMVSTSLSMIPALMIAQGADLVDLDGPLLLAKDRENGLDYQEAMILPENQRLWGVPRS